ncbi:serine/threonine-protein kinase [Kamptonema formosum]|uniref:serine/threonine-protein kinase n=1 Tax=Kamptonema formosum TaxID=331992 RepID=UPI00034892BD|nr:serine/threonine-protein kinase [Oscillatoria sp. PCC 10802]
MIGQLLDRRYRIIKVLGSSPFAQTYLAADTHRPGYPQCVVKQLRSPSNHPRTLQVLELLFKKKAETLEKLGKHDHIPQLLAVFQENKDFYLVEEFIAGQTLAAEMATGQPLREDQAIRLLEEMLEILVFVHQHGIIHQNIQPENLIRRQSDGKLVLLDFGAFKEISAQLPTPPKTPPLSGGKPISKSYKPIEQVQGNPLPASDIYATGMIVIQALTGLGAEDLASVRDPGSSAAGELFWRHRAQVSPELAEVIDRMVRYDLNQRYQSASEVLADLRRIRRRAGGSQLGLPLTVVEHSYFRLQQHLRGMGSRRMLSPLFAVPAALVAAGGFGLSFYLQTQNIAGDLKSRGVEKATRGDRTGAIEDYNQAIRFNPNDAEAYYKRGNVNYDAGKLKEAKEDYSQALRLNPNFANAYYNRGLANYDLKEYQAAVDDYTEALRINPNDGEAYYKRGLAHLELREYPAAIEDCTRAIQQNPNDAKSYISRGLARAASGDQRGGLADFTQAIRIDYNNGEAFYNRGKVRFSMADYQGAVEDYSEAIRINPQYAGAYSSRCESQLNLSEFERAVEDCSSALKLNPNDAVAAENRCVAYFNLGNYQNAIEDCTQAIALNPNNSQAYSDRGLARSAGGDKSGAIEDYTRAIRINPSDAVAYSKRAEAHLDLGDSSSAIEDYTQAIRLKREHEGAYYGRGLLRAQIGDKQGAIQDLQKAAKLCLDQGNTGCYNDAQLQLKKLQP